MICNLATYFREEVLRTDILIKEFYGFYYFHFIIYVTIISARRGLSQQRTTYIMDASEISCHDKDVGLKTADRKVEFWKLIRGLLLTLFWDKPSNYMH